MHCEISHCAIFNMRSWEYKWVVLTGLEHVWLQIGLPTDGFIGHPAANAAVPKFNCTTRVNTQNNDVCPFDIFNPYIAPDVYKTRKLFNLFTCIQVERVRYN
jgi:hypothetical protein